MEIKKNMDHVTLRGYVIKSECQVYRGFTKSPRVEANYKFVFDA